MANQVEGLQRAHIPGTYINSDITRAERCQRYELMDQQAWKLLYLTPERFDPTMVRDPTEIARIAAIRPSFLVVDEAHCVDRWGNDFRPNYGRLNGVRETLGNLPVLAFTTTAGQQLQRCILDSLGIPSVRVFVSGVDRPNIALVRQVEPDNRERCRLVARLIRKHAGTGKVMVFVPTRRIGGEVCVGLRAEGLDVPFYHGQLTRNAREALFARFTGRNEPVLDAIVCTNAFSMGIDIPNIRAVVHWVQAASVEDYLQEFGRAGRDGRPALAVVFKRPRDIGVLEFMAERTAAEAASQGRDGSAVLEARMKRIAELDAMIGSRACFRKQIRAYFEGTGPPRRRSLALRILAWGVSRSTRSQKAGFCCDACHPRQAKRALIS